MIPEQAEHDTPEPRLEGVDTERPEPGNPIEEPTGGGTDVVHETDPGKFPPEI